MFMRNIAGPGWRWGVALLLIVALAPGVVRAAPASQSSGGEIRLLSPVYGTLDEANPAVTYSFYMNADMVFSFWAWNETGDAVKSMVISTPSGETLAEGTIYGPENSWTTVEALIAPVDGIYSVILGRESGASTEYGLALLPGYSTIEVFDLFDGGDSSLALTWEAFDTGSVAGEVVDEQLQMSIWVDNMLGYMVPEEELNYGNFYVESDVSILGNPSYYEYGLLFRMDTSGDVETFYVVEFSSDSDYSVYYYDGAWETIVEWTVSPVIDGADRNPHIGVMATDNSFRIYFNDRLVDVVNDPNNFASAGQIAVAAGTLADQTDIVQLTHDNLVITVPDPDLAEVLAPGSSSEGTGLGGLFSATGTPVSGVPFDLGGGSTSESQDNSANLTNWNTSDPAVIVGELVQKGLVPSVGTLAMEIPSSFGDTSSAGYNYYPLGRGQSFGNFVMGFDTQLLETGAGSGCGMHFRAAGAGYDVALVFEEGAVAIAGFAGGELDPASVYQMSPVVNAGQGATNRVTVVANGPDVLMYVNGELTAQTAFTPGVGTVALNVFVNSDDAGRTERTYCELQNIWLWEF